MHHVRQPTETSSSSSSSSSSAAAAAAKFYDTYTKHNSTHACTLITEQLTRDTLNYSVRRYDSAVCCSKMSCDAFLSEALYEADKADGEQSRR